MVEVLEARLDAEVGHPSESTDGVVGEPGARVKAEEEPECLGSGNVAATTSVAELGKQGPEEGELAGGAEGMNESEVGGWGVAEARDGGGPEEEAVGGGREVAATYKNPLGDARGEGGGERAERRGEVVVGRTVVAEDAANVVDEGGRGGEGRPAAAQVEDGAAFGSPSDSSDGHGRFGQLDRL